MTTFKLPGEPIKGDTPINQYPFWKWADAQPERTDVDIHNYLKAVGFVIHKDRLSPEDFQALRNACEHWHLVTPHMKGEFAFSDLFTPVGLGQIGYYVQGAPGSVGTRYTANAALCTALVHAGWIHSVEPSTTYFQLENGMLWARYQTILGQRPMARVKV